MDDYIGLAIPETRAQLQHAANAILHSIHNVFPGQPNDNQDPISIKKVKKGDVTWRLVKDILGFTFEGARKML